MKKNKISILIALLTVVIFFSVAAICNQCGITPTTTTITEKVDVGETTAAETTAAGETTAAETTAAKTYAAETIAAETTAKTTVPTEPAVKEAPTISLAIYEGPTPVGSDTCYYRVLATVTGKPAPTISFSKDDSGGAWGKDRVQVNISKSSPSYTLTATVKNSVGEATDSIVLNWGCGPLTVEKTIDLHPSISGTVGPAGFVTTEFLAIGDSPANSDWRGRFAFDVSELEGKEIVDASLKLEDPELTPEPCNFKGVIVIFYNNFLPGLTAADYGSVAYAGPEMFLWNKDPLEFSTDFLKTEIAERASAHTELQFGIGYANNATGGLSGVAAGRVYYGDDITLTITYNE